MMFVASVATICLLMTLATVMPGSTTLQEANDCVTYRAKLTSIPDLEHNVVYQARQKVNYVIYDVKSTAFERSYYWCELNITQKGGNNKKYRHFGFNSTHWWVEKGCGGWFMVTECRLVDGDSSTSYTTVSPASGSEIAANESGYSVLVNAPTDLVSPQLEDQDDPYKKWPRIGFMSPHSDIMWDLLDKATYVDVPEQLGFYKPHRKPRSASAMDDLSQDYTRQDLITAP